MKGFVECLKSMTCRVQGVGAIWLTYMCPTFSTIISEFCRGSKLCRTPTRCLKRAHIYVQVSKCFGTTRRAFRETIIWRHTHIRIWANSPRLPFSHHIIIPIHDYLFHGSLRNFIHFILWEECKLMHTRISWRNKVAFVAFYQSVKSVTLLDKTWKKDL